MKLSIIIPIYNIEGYLPTCLNSILQQDFSDYELLLINDGSTDSSGKICDEFALKNDHIRVFHKENAGVSAARNLGLEKAEGKWICFIDGDDQIEKDSLKTLMDYADLNDPELLIARSFHYENGVKKQEKYPFDNSFLNNSYGGYELIVSKSYKRGSVWGGIFNRSFLNKNQIRFPISLKNGEDSIFISLCHLYAKRLFFIDVDFYLVTEREGSASRSWSFDRVYKMVDNLRFLNNYIDAHPLSEEQRAILDFSKYGVISNIFNNLYHSFSFRNYFKILRAVRKELEYKLYFGKILLNKKKVKLLNLSLSLFSASVLFNQMFRQLSSQ